MNKRDMKHIVFFFLIGLTSCMFDPIPPIKYKMVDFKYSNNNEWFYLPTSKKDLINYTKDLSKDLLEYNDSIYGSSFVINETSLQPIMKLLVIETNGVTKIKLLTIDSILYLDNNNRDKKYLSQITKDEYYKLFKKDFVSKFVNSIYKCVKLDSLYQKGLDYFDSNQLELAYNCFDVVSKMQIRDDGMFKFPQYSAYNRMGYIRIKQQKFNEAVENFNKAFLIEPWWLKIENRGDQFRANGKLPNWVHDNYLDELKSEYKFNCIRTYQLLIHANKAYALFQLGKIDDAEKILNGAKKMYINEPNTQISIGISYYLNGDFQKSFDVYDKLNDLDADILDFHYYKEEAKKKK